MCHPLFKVSDMVGLKMAPRFDRNPFVVAFYSLKLLLEIFSVINVKKNVSNTRSPSFGASIRIVALGQPGPVCFYF